MHYVYVACKVWKSKKLLEPFSSHSLRLLRVGWHLTALSTQIRLPVCCAVRSVKFIVTYLIINYLFTALTVVLLQV